MTPAILLDTIIDPALRLVESRYRTDEARAMLIAVALQESKITDRRQVLDAGKRWWESRPGKANGLWMFERGGAVYGVLTHPAAQRFIVPVLLKLEYPADSEIVHDALIHNDVLACLMARALLVTLPAQLPGRDDPAEGWRQYIEAWRPGQPHEKTWSTHYATAWRTVQAKP